MATFYIVENNQQAGPFTVEQLRAKGIAPETYVWSEGMSGWEQASNVGELQSLFQPAQPAQPQYQAQPAQPQYQAQPAQPQYQAQPAQPQYQAQPTQPQYQAQPQPQQQSYAQPQRSTTSGGEMMPKPKDWKPFAIGLMVASVVCCGVCGGIINLVMGFLAYQQAGKVDTLYNMKDYAGAKAASDKARTFVIIGGVIMAIGLFIELIYIIVVVANS